MPAKRMTIEEAEAQADQWEAEWEAHCEQAAREAHFKNATPKQLTGMWRSGKNLEGRRLSNFEWGALCEAWCATFGCLPPDRVRGSEGGSHQAITEPLPPDNIMVPMSAVTQVTSLSESTIKRKVKAGEFPAPVKLSVRRIAWLMHEVRRYVEGKWPS